MKNRKLLGATALRSIAFAGLALGALPAHAQDGTAASAAAGDTDAPANAATALATADPAIVVTGSRIRRPNLESTIPITSIDGAEFFETGNIAVGDILNELPQLQSTFSQANSTRFLGTAGLNLLDLRGLGTQRTLVLVNGRRHVAGDILNNGVSTDINTIPTDLIDRVDVVTGGDSAVYGSDAIAGVVNFVLKQHFEGVQLRGQGGVSTYGDAGSYFGSLLVGKNFAGGRGNIAVNLEYARQNQYFASGRPYLRQQDGFIVVDTDPAGTPNGSDGNPDRIFFRDFRSASLTNTGLVRFGGNARLSCGTDAAGGLFNCPYTFLPDGTLAPLTGTRVGIGPNGSFIGGNGENFRGGDQFQLQPNLDRYNANLIAHFTVTDAFEPFVELTYSRTKTRGTGSNGPAFITGTTLGDAREQPRLDNPFLTDQARGLIISQLILQNGAAPAANARFSLRENLLGLGVRSEEATRQTYRGVVGVRGTFNDDWNYEVSANYGQFRERTDVLGNLDIQRFLLAADAVRDPATGQIVCNARISPAAATGYALADPAVAAGRLAGDIAACVPVNLFGGRISDAARNYLLTDTTSIGNITQFVASASLSGDSSQLFSLPGGPIGFAIGAEYRRETNSFRADPIVQAGLTFYNALPTFSAPAFEVKEVFGEIRAPLLKDLPLAHELTFSAAGRVADYRGATGTVYAYNLGLDYAPIRDLRFRGNFSRAVRAPNLIELFSEQGQNFAGGFTDPCSARNIGAGSSTRAANCAAAGRPAAYDFVYSQSLEFRSGGNPDLREEKSDSWTLGAVLQPRVIPGLSLSVDYYDIKVKNVISVVAAQTIVDQCYDQATLNNVFCSLFQRAGAGGGPKGEIPFQILEGSLLQSSLNFAGLRARGIDTELAYRRNVPGFGAVSARLNYTHVLQLDNFLNPDDRNRADQLLSELGDPQDEFSFNLDVKQGPVTIGYKARYIGKQVINFFEDISSKQGRPPENQDFADILHYPSVLYHDARIGIDASNRLNFYLGVDNLFDRKPPLGLTGIGGGSAIYDVRGRFFYAGATAHF